MEEVEYDAFSFTDPVFIEINSPFDGFMDAFADGCSVQIISYACDPPSFTEDSFQSMSHSIKVYYPDNKSWIGVAGKTYGAPDEVVWIPYSCNDHHMTKSEMILPTCTEDGEFYYQCDSCGVREDIPYIYLLTDVNVEEDSENYEMFYFKDPFHRLQYIEATNEIAAHWHCDRCEKDYLDAACTQEMTDDGVLMTGDCNNDKTVDAKDLTALARHLAKIEMISDVQILKNADTNRDGVVTALDLTQLAKYVAKIITAF